MKKKLLLATRNAHKIREISLILKEISSPFETLVSLLDFPSYIPPEEDEDSFQKNALKKALHASLQLNLPSLADDSGLVVPALNGAPGIFSARFASPHATDEENRKKLLSLIKNFSEGDRKASYECCMAFALPSKITKTACASCSGMLLTKETGSFGFGYDPLFFYPEKKKTFAEMDENTKNSISHRRKALELLFSSLQF